MIRAAGRRAACLLLLFGAAVASGSGPDAGSRGQATSLSARRLKEAERVYRDGVLPSGAPLRAERSGTEVSGATAACASCHRRSGMGSVEGGQIVPPVAGRFLFLPRAETREDLRRETTRGPDLAHARGRDRKRPPYTRETLKAAIREGRDPGGVLLDALMPRYALDDAEADLLVDYLTHLSESRSPGVTDEEIHFGTVIGAGVEPRRRQALLDLLRAYFDVRNSGLERDRAWERGTAQGAVKRYRRWVLHAWDLHGPPATWKAQLSSLYAAEPVFALISGTARGTWAPVSEFCEAEGIPAWFPTVDLPVSPDASWATTYFSGGVVLEAKALARRLLDDGRWEKVRVVRGGDEVAAAAASTLEAALSGRAIEVEEKVLGRIDGPEMTRTLAGAGEDEAVVLWLRGEELGALSGVRPPGGPVFLSTLLSEGEAAPLPDAWRATARFVYPFELPAKRKAKTLRFHAWLAQRGLPIVDERLQGDAWLACVLMAEKVDDMLETLQRDYLLDRAEEILSERLPTVMYHRLSLGPGQRVASKGAFIARFGSPEAGSLVADSEWIVP